MGKEEIINIERLEMMEEKFGVSIDGAYAEFEENDVDSRYITITGEIQAVSGSTIDESIDVIFTAYNAEGKVIATGSRYFPADEFFGLSPFEFCESVIEKPTKIRIYPKLG
jgi:hypothetical protein